MKKILLGNEAIVQAALDSDVDFVSGYPGCPAAEVGDIFGKIAKENGVYYEWSTNEKVGLEAAIGASFSGLKALVNMKSFGINVCSDSLLPLAYTGTKGPMVIVIGDDPSCWSSAQTEQNSRAYAYLSRIPFLEPADPQECYEFTKLGFEISERFNIPVILRTTTRVAHQKMPVSFAGEYLKKQNKQQKRGKFVKNPRQFCTMPPRVLEMKKELLEKVEKIRKFAEGSIINKVSSGKSKIGIIASGVSYLHAMEAQSWLGLNLPILKLGFFYPLPEKKIKDFIKGLKKVLIVEELDGYIEKEIKAIAKDTNPKLEVFGKNVLPETRELDAEKVASALSGLANKKFTAFKVKDLGLLKRYPHLCLGCPHMLTFQVLKKLSQENIIFGGDIGCYMIAGYPPHNMQDYIFSMGASLGISHGVKKTTGQKLISLIGDGTFFHSGITALINAVYNKSNPLVIVLDNRITAMTGQQTNPGVGTNGIGEEVPELRIEEIAKACGVKHIKVIDPINSQELETTIRDFLEKDEVSLIVSKRICALLAKRQKNG